ncbi:MAG: ion transporter [Gammaproteobacteria bacterium]|nr:ion transporter [Gammaproteobacteria bacterium]MDH5630214.1 ion transporter [Gammaproteobacteria bacterium]
MSKKLKAYSQGEPLSPWREKIHEVIFEADTFAGKLFDAFLIFAIIVSVVVVMLESVVSIKTAYGIWLDNLEWFFTILFLIEYILRLISVRKPLLYATSFFGIVDIISILPSFIGLFFAGAETLLVVRVLRVLRIFRIFKLGEYLGEANMLIEALKGSRKKIAVFLYTVFIFVVIFGSTMYLVEGDENGFTSIPRSIYWAIVTLTTVGYGDIVPQTHFGQVIASAVMIMGYAIIAVPTGIYSAELANVYRKKVTNNACMNCGEEGHDSDAVHCKFCGYKL